VVPTKALHSKLGALIALLLSVAVAMLTTPISTVVTPRGVQCPTARIQTVTEVRYVRNCCGKLVAQTIERAPREGEAEFKQCRCAEKKALERHDQAKSADSRPSLTVWFEAESSCQIFTISVAMPRQKIPWTTGQFASVLRSPDSPPPRFIYSIKT